MPKPSTTSRLTPTTHYAPTPTTLPTGDGESLARCAYPPCGTTFVPRHVHHTYHTRACQDAAHSATRKARMARNHSRNASYRLALRALRRLGCDPAETPWRDGLARLRGQGVVEGWREVVGLPPERRGVRRDPAATLPAPVSAKPARAYPRHGTVSPSATVAPLPATPHTPVWEADAAAQGVAVGAIAGDATERLWFAECPALAIFPSQGLTFTTSAPVAWRNVRHLHGALSHIVGRPHGNTLPAWSLIPLDAAPIPRGAPPGTVQPRPGCLWGVLFLDPADAARLRGSTVATRLGATPATITFGGAITTPRLPPRYPPGAYRVTVETVTPAVVRGFRGDGTVGASPHATRLTPKSLASIVAQTLAMRLGVAHTGPVQPAVWDVADRLTTHREYVGGHFGRGADPGTLLTRTGALEVLCNAPAAWLLKTAEAYGFGGMVSLGYGRVRVTVVAATRPAAPVLAATGVEVTACSVQRLRERFPHHTADAAGQPMRDEDVVERLRGWCHTARYLGWCRRAGLYYTPDVTTRSAGAAGDDGVAGAAHPEMVFVVMLQDGAPPALITVLPTDGTGSTATRRAARLVRGPTPHGHNPAA